MSLHFVELARPSSAADAAVVQQVTLIRPGIVAAAGAWIAPVTPPLGLAYLAAMVREMDVPVAVIDALGEAPDQLLEKDGFVFQGLTFAETVRRIPADATIIGISCMFTQDWPWTRLLIRAVRERFPDALIVAGGEHVTAVPEFCLRDCPALDVCVLGEGEETLVELIRAGGHRARFQGIAGLAFLENDRFVKTCGRARIREVESIPRPAWDLFPMEAYLSNRNAHGVYRGRSMGILATRGCPYKCTFCSNPLMYGKAWIAREVDDVLDEIQHYIDVYRAENIDFYDLTMIVKRQWILEFCEKIEKRGMKFTWQLPSGTRSEVIDDEVAAALYRTGCRNVAYAPESGSERTLDLIKKRVDLKNLLASIRAALRNNIVIRVNLILGFPHDTRSDLLKTVWFGWKLAVVGVHDAGFYLFSAYPGTQLFDELLAEGRIKGLDDEYFRSLLGYKNFLSFQNYCRHVRGPEVAFWRFFGMASFYAISFALRPWRFVALVKNIIKHESNTSLEQRLGAMVRQKAPAKAVTHPAQAGAV